MEPVSETSLEWNIDDIKNIGTALIDANTGLSPESNEIVKGGFTVFGKQWADTQMNNKYYYGETAKAMYHASSTPLELLFNIVENDDSEVFEYNEFVFGPSVARRSAAKVNARTLSFTRKKFREHSKWLSERIMMPDARLNDAESVKARHDALLLAITCMLMTEMLTIFDKILTAENVNGKLSSEGSDLIPDGPMTLVDMINSERPLFACINKDPSAFVRDVQPYLSNALNRATVSNAALKKLGVIVCSNKLRDAVISNSEAKKLNMYVGKEAEANRLARIETSQSGVGRIGDYPCVSPPHGSGVLHDRLFSDLMKSKVQIGEWFDFQNTTVGKTDPKKFRSDMRSVFRYNMETDDDFEQRWDRFLKWLLEFQGSESQETSAKSSGAISLTALIRMGISVSHKKAGKVLPAWTSPITGVDYIGKEYMISPLLRHTPNAPMEFVFSQDQTTGTAKFNNGDNRLHLSPVCSFVEMDFRVAKNMDHFYDIARERIFDCLDETEKTEFVQLYDLCISQPMSSVAELYEKRFPESTIKLSSKGEPEEVKGVKSSTKEEDAFLVLWERVVERIASVFGRHHWAVSDSLTSQVKTDDTMANLHGRLPSSLQKVALNASHTVLHSFRNMRASVDERKEEATGRYSDSLSGTVLGQLNMITWDPSQEQSGNQFKRRRVNQGADIRRNTTDANIISYRFLSNSYKYFRQTLKKDGFNSLPAFVRYAVAFPITHFPEYGPKKNEQTDSEKRWAETHAFDILTGIAARVYLSSTLDATTFQNLYSNNVDIALGGVACSPFMTFKAEHVTGISQMKLGKIARRGWETFATNFNHGDMGLEATYGFAVVLSRPSALAHCKNIFLVEYLGGYGNQYFNHDLDIMNNEAHLDTMQKKFGKGEEMKNNCLIPILCGLQTSLASENIPPVFDIRNHTRLANVVNRLDPRSRELRPKKAPEVDGIEFMLYVLRPCIATDQPVKYTITGNMQFADELELYETNYICGRSNYRVFDPDTGGQKDVKSHSLLGKMKPKSKMQFIGESMVKVQATR